MKGGILGGEVFWCKVWFRAGGGAFQKAFINTLNKSESTDKQQNIDWLNTHIIFYQPHTRRIRLSWGRFFSTTPSPECLRIHRGLSPNS